MRRTVFAESRKCQALRIDKSLFGQSTDDRGRGQGDDGKERRGGEGRGEPNEAGGDEKEIAG